MEATGSTYFLFFQSHSTFLHILYREAQDKISKSFSLKNYTTDILIEYTRYASLIQEIHILLYFRLF